MDSKSVATDLNRGMGFTYPIPDQREINSLLWQHITGLHSFCRDAWAMWIRRVARPPDVVGREVLLTVPPE